MSAKRCFPPVVDANTRLLVLGSLPGEVSLAQGQYYANKHNRFWYLMGDILGQDLPWMDYPARLQTLLQHRVGLWDVVAEAQREGSLDSKIRHHASNDLIGLADALPQLAAIAFNGGAAEKLGSKALLERAGRHQWIKLPSSSPAYTVPYPDKLQAWQVLRAWL
jgi:hypoxanthine-DNA glycosylase